MKLDSTNNADKLYWILKCSSCGNIIAKTKERLRFGHLLTPECLIPIQTETKKYQEGQKLICANCKDEQVISEPIDKLNWEKLKQNTGGK